jgi:hypothetical protein
MRMMKLSHIIAAVGFTLVLSTANASEFRAVGPRALSMGGAAVACPTPAYAAYYNPAALGLDPDKCALDLSVGGNVRDSGIAPHLNILMNSDWNSAKGNPEGAEAASIIAEIEKIKNTDGIMVMPGAGIGLRIGSFAGGAYPSAQLAIYSHLDTTHLNQSDPMTDPNSFAFNTSELYAQGLGLVEVPIAYGQAFKLGNGTICVGGAIKFIEGATYDVRQGIVVTADTDYIQDKLENASEMSTGFGIDAGILYRTLEDKLSVGVLARNINSPAFKTATGHEFTEDAQFRAGVAYSVFESLLLAVDIDLTANKTLIAGYTSRQLSAGLCFQPGWITLRGGIMKNLEMDSAPVVWTLGGSLGDEVFHIDLAASIAGSWQTLDKFDIPTEGGLTLALGGCW